MKLNLIFQILSASDVYYDSSDVNASLYLCFTPGTPSEKVDRIINLMRGNSAWFGKTKYISNDQKQSYYNQLKFAECAFVSRNGVGFLVLRASHQKFPSSNESWRAWRRVLTSKKGHD